MTEQQGIECVRADYSLRDDSLIRVLNSGQRRDDGETEFQPRLWLEGKARKAGSTDHEAKLQVNFFAEAWGNLHIIETDYKTFSLAYGCDMRGPTKKESAWVLTRHAVDSVEKRLDEADFKSIFESKIPGFNYTYVFADSYAIQGTANGCDSPQSEEPASNEETQLFF